MLTVSNIHRTNLQTTRSTSKSHRTLCTVLTLLGIFRRKKKPSQWCGTGYSNSKMTQTPDFIFLTAKTKPGSKTEIRTRANTHTGGLFTGKSSKTLY